MVELRVTCPDTAAARRIARAALEARLAACANILPGVRSLFWWDGAIAEEDEVLLSFKTRQATLASLIALVTEEHPYDLPVLEWTTLVTTPEARAWLIAETGG